MKSTWNEVNNGPLSYSWQCSDLEMLIPSWDTLYHNMRLRIWNRISALCFSKANRRVRLIPNHQSWLISNWPNY
jgi:hypothetical protein